MNHRIWSYLLCALVSFSGAPYEPKVTIEPYEKKVTRESYEKKVNIFTDDDGTVYMTMPWAKSSTEASSAVQKGELHSMYEILDLKIGVDEISKDKMPEGLMKLEEDPIFRKFIYLMSLFVALCGTNKLFETKVSIYSGGDSKALEVAIDLYYNGSSVSHSRKHTDVQKVIYEDMDPKYQEIIDKSLINYFRGSKVEVSVNEEKKDADFNTPIDCKHKLTGDEDTKLLIITMILKAYRIKPDFRRMSRSSASS